MSETQESGQNSLTPDQQVNLLNVYATQFGSYTTLLWQVPVLGLTAQSFLLTIALGAESKTSARVIAAVLSIIISSASLSLMHEQRGRSITYGQLAKTFADRLGLNKILVKKVDDMIPNKDTNAADVWTEPGTKFPRGELIYSLWMLCLFLFFFADAFVIISPLLPKGWQLG
jgi:hypothetical protein